MGSLFRQPAPAAARDVHFQAGGQKRSRHRQRQAASVTIDGLTVGPFAGSLELSFYAGSRLMRIDALLKTEKDRLAVFYDTGLVADRATWKRVRVDRYGRPQPARSYRPISGSRRATARSRSKVRHRAIAAAGDQGAVACFPPPHQFQFPRDYSTNLGFVWAGSGYQGQTGKTGFGVRQNKDGGGNFVPVVQCAARRDASDGRVSIC